MCGSVARVNVLAPRPVLCWCAGCSSGLGLSAGSDELCVWLLLGVWLRCWGARPLARQLLPMLLLGMLRLYWGPRALFLPCVVVLGGMAAHRRYAMEVFRAVGCLIAALDSFSGGPSGVGCGLQEREEQCRRGMEALGGVSGSLSLQWHVSRRLEACTGICLGG
jgi:hypothetical protein